MTYNDEITVIKDREKGRKGEKETTSPGSSADPADVPRVLGLVGVLFSR